MCDLTEPPLLSAHFSDAENVRDCRKANPKNSLMRWRQPMPPLLWPRRRRITFSKAGAQFEALGHGYTAPTQGSPQRRPAESLCSPTSSY